MSSGKRLKSLAHGGQLMLETGAAAAGN